MAAAAVFLLSAAAGAYPAMIRHGYTQCASCHTDPSGGSLLNEYGRAQSELLLSSRWGKDDDAEPARSSRALFGLVELPSGLTAGAWLREGYLWNVVAGALVDHRQLQMRADVAADLHVGNFRAAATAGYASAGTALLASVTGSSGANLVSREHWLGVASDDDAILLRGGRIGVPFGLRNAEHPSFVRSATRTDLDQDQQDGLALSIASRRWRAEAMAIAGNASLHPDALRERGVAATFEVAVAPRAVLGVSALAARSDADRESLLPTFRQAYGATARLAPFAPLAITAELDLLLTTALGVRTGSGHASWLQADLETLRGVHLLAAAETLHAPSTAGISTGLWAGAAWFVLPHLDVRADWIRRWPAGSTATDTFLAQLNGYL